MPTKNDVFFTAGSCNKFLPFLICPIWWVYYVFPTRIPQKKTKQTTPSVTSISQNSQNMTLYKCYVYVLAISLLESGNLLKSQWLLMMQHRSISLLQQLFYNKTIVVKVKSNFYFRKCCWFCPTKHVSLETKWSQKSHSDANETCLERCHFGYEQL